VAAERPTPTGPLSPDLTIVESRVYRGPNVWSYEKSIHLVVDLGVLEGYPTDTIPLFTDKLLELLPGLQRHACSRGRAGGFVERLREGTWLGHVAEHMALQLQTEAGHDQRRGKTRGVRGTTGRYNVIYGYTDETVGLAAGRLATRLVNHLVSAEEGFDFDTELDAFLRLAERTAFGPSTAAIIEEAVSRDIPWIRLNSASLVQLGQGVHAQRIRATMTSRTGALAVDIASDKDLTTQLLASAGLPVPKQEAVRTARALVEAAERIGYPVVVKPLDGNHGRGVCLNLQNAAEVERSFEIARGESKRGTVVVESFVTGRDYRCLIVGGRMQAIAERVPAHVVGDGEHTVGELVELTNADPRRGIGHEKVLTRIRVDVVAEEVLAGQGLRLDDVPPTGEMVKLALTGNMSTGGISVDRTFEAHPDNVEISEEAARMIGLDVAGIDFICPDIASPVRETGGAICEVNAAPGFRMHTHLHGRGPAVHRQARRRPAVPTGHAVTGADHRRHRHEREDDDLPDDRPHLQGPRPQGRHDLHRWDRHRRAPRDQGGCLRPEVSPDGPAEPPGRLRRHGGRPRRHHPRGAGLRPQRRRGRHERLPRPPRAAGHRHRRAACSRQGRRR